jgi:hypothetical protein
MPTVTFEWRHIALFLFVGMLPFLLLLHEFSALQLEHQRDAATLPHFASSAASSSSSSSSSGRQGFQTDEQWRRQSLGDDDDNDDNSGGGGGGNTGAVHGRNDDDDGGGGENVGATTTRKRKKKKRKVTKKKKKKKKKKATGTKAELSERLSRTGKSQQPEKGGDAQTKNASTKLDDGGGETTTTTTTATAKKKKKGKTEKNAKTSNKSKCDALVAEFTIVRGKFWGTATSKEKKLWSKWKCDSIVGDDAEKALNAKRAAQHFGGRKEVHETLNKEIDIDGDAHRRAAGGDGKLWTVFLVPTTTKFIKRNNKMRDEVSRLVFWQVTFRSFLERTRDELLGAGAR